MTEKIHAEFDECSTDYDAALAQGLSVSGEDKDFFARGRVEWTRKCLQLIGEKPNSVMDYGCGIGSSTNYFLDLLNVDSLLGIDVSPKSLELGRQKYGIERVDFRLPEEYQPNEQIDLAFCNGVFHHIALDKRDAEIDYIYRSLRPGGIFAFWENNPWNPGTHYVMSKIPFDKDAITLSPPTARRLIRRGGFQILRTDFLFIFPRFLRWFRRIEPLVATLPLGAQYQILCRKS